MLHSYMLLLLRVELMAILTLGMTFTIYACACAMTDKDDDLSPTFLVAMLILTLLMLPTALLLALS